MPYRSSVSPYVTQVGTTDKSPDGQGENGKAIDVAFHRILLSQTSLSVLVLAQSLTQPPGLAILRWQSTCSRVCPLALQTHIPPHVILSQSTRAERLSAASSSVVR